jgi:hypothetical protein
MENRLVPNEATRTIGSSSQTPRGGPVRNVGRSCESRIDYQRKTPSGNYAVSSKSTRITHFALNLHQNGDEKAVEVPKKKRKKEKDKGIAAFFVSKPK